MSPRGQATSPGAYMLWETSHPQASRGLFTICASMGLGFPTYTTRRCPRPGLLRDQAGNRRKGSGLVPYREWEKQARVVGFFKQRQEFPKAVSSPSL